MWDHLVAQISGDSYFTDYYDYRGIKFCSNSIYSKYFINQFKYNLSFFTKHFWENILNYFLNYNHV